MKYILSLLLSCILANALAQWTTSGTNIYNSNSGNVGIGTSTLLAPIAPLHIYGVVNGELNFLIQNNFTNGARTFISSFPGKSAIQTDRDFTIMTNGGGWSDKFILTNGGNVGIGTTTPQTRLEVFGGRLTQSGDIPNDNNATFVNNAPSGYGIYSKGGAGTRYAFHFENHSGTSVMYGRGDGNVGIGTINPDAKLAVKGTVHAQEVKVDLNVPAPDYVFEADYNLPSLQEVETYIQQNKHLPEVPSANEMEQHGINLSEMNMLLLKKIEELTLHLIDQNKKLSDQNQIIKTQNNRLLELEKLNRK
jgi:Phage T4 tail fibre